MDLLLSIEIPVSKFVGALLMVTIIAVISVGGMVLLVKLYKSRIEATASEQQLAWHRVEEATLKRLAGDLHSGLGQRMVAANTTGADLRERMADLLPPDLLLDVDQHLQLCQDSLHELRLVSQVTYGDTLLKQGLLVALQTDIRLLQLQSKLRPEVELPAVEPPLAKGQQLLLYRMFQDLVGNVRKHAAASWVGIRLTCGPDAATLVVSDDGVGFDAATLGAQTGMGIHTLYRRTAELHGSVVIRSVPGRGTTVTVTIPITSIPKTNNDAKNNPYPND